MENKIVRDVCSNCRMLFNESSVQAYRRITKGSSKACSDCYRLSMAEARAIKRGMLRNRTCQEQEVMNVNTLIKKYGKVNENILMVKLKISNMEAKQICQNLYK